MPEICDYFGLTIRTERLELEKIKKTFFQTEKKVKAFFEESFKNRKEEANKEVMIRLPKFFRMTLRPVVK